MLSSVKAIVVHHRSLSTIASCVSSLNAAGLRNEDITIVDNSGDEDLFRELSTVVSSDIDIYKVQNRGYAAAINDGMRHLEESSTEYVLICTHEVVLESGCLDRMLDVADSDSSIALVGPTLTSGEDNHEIWSAGGLLTKWLRIPRHRKHRRPRPERFSTGSSDVDWLDGAMLLYRRAALVAIPLDEDYFLYMEEVDHHQTLIKSGWKVKVAKDAIAWQSSSGAPGYWTSRNCYRFQLKHGTVLSKLITPRYLLLRNIVSLVRQPRGRLQDLQRLRNGWLMRKVSGTAPVMIYNPLGAALTHYTNELEEQLEAIGCSTLMKSVVEPSASQSTRLSWLVRYLLILASDRFENGSQLRGPRIAVWPTMGYWDLLFLRILCGKNAWLVIHDPRPLVRNVGHGYISRGFARVMYKDPKIIVHSELAAAHLKADIGLRTTATIAHPISARNFELWSAKVVREDKRVVRVFGQYKADRDISALIEIAHAFDESVVLEIFGRGWPDIEGWDVTSEFVSESSLDSLIAESSVVVIPYARFYQSGIAIRCLEAGIPFIGPRRSSLSKILGSESELLVDDDWAGTVLKAMEIEHGETRRIAIRYFSESQQSWDGWHRRAVGYPPLTLQNLTIEGA